MSSTSGWAKRVGAGAALVGLFGLGHVSMPQAMSRTWAQPPAAGAQVAVIVQAAPSSLTALENAATAAGGRVTRELGVISGFAARVPAAALPRLRALPGVVSVTVDGTAKPMSATTLAGLNSDSTETGSLSAIEQIIGVPGAWAAGWTGKGVDVAVIDTGVSRVTGLAGAGQVIDGPDLSLDSQNPDLARLDSYGHGTFMAGLIAGRDPGAGPLTDPNRYVGVAPDARIVNVKVGATDGATDVSQVIAGIDWVVQHAHDPGLNIRVLNLSYGSTALQPYTVDPLAQAAEQAWKHGIVVVAAAGNDGKQVPELANPAYDPYLLAVGADDPNGTLAATDDTVPGFAQHGSTTRAVDVVTPGTHVLGLRVPGSFIDTLPGNQGRVGDRFQRGSGTSQSAAIASGLAALAIQAHPEATPDQIKALITTTAVQLPKYKKKNNDKADLKSKWFTGSGIPQADTTATSPLPSLGSATQTWTASTGAGSLDAARGGVFIASGGVPLTGQQDIFGQAYDSAAMAALRTTGRTWVGGTWNASRWAGDDWTASRWADATWTGNDWTGSRWAASRWAGMTWTGSRWAGTGWTASRWADSSWTASRWADATLD